MSQPRQVLVLVVLVLVALLSACQQDRVEPTPTLSPQQAEFLDAIAQWRAAGIENYTMRVTYRGPGWNPQVLNIRVTDGEPEVERHVCFPERTCAIRQMEVVDLSLDNIFNNAEQLAQRNEVGHVVYNDEYGFPRIIDTSEGDWEISDFQVVQE